MSSSDIAIRITNVSKCYELYSYPADRLKQFILPKLWRLFGGRSARYYKEFWAVNNISFVVTKGQTVGIIGRNGSGKSTLLQMICGTLSPTNGMIEVHGRVAALLELGSGFNLEFTGRENIYLNASVLGLTKEQIDERFSSIVDFADIGEFIDQSVKTYSSGMLVRLAFAVIAHVDADILVIDEALAVGDAFFTQKCMRFLRNFMSTGTVLFVSHDTGSIKSLCNRAIWLEKGKAIIEGDPKEICERYLEAFYEVQQGASSTTKFKSKIKDEAEHLMPLKDQRLEFINKSNIRNDLKVYEFDPEASAFGLGGAQIIDVKLLDGKGDPLAWVVGGETVQLKIEVHTHQELDTPIVGFFIKDRLGQNLFGDNTFLSYCDNPIHCRPEDRIETTFMFQMPLLPAGDYSITAAIANGTQQVHLQHHWVHDAVQFRSESSSVSTGLIGIPMHLINMKVR
jgi:lipopolysaccharide transport system ATP-binding protein